jgi:integrase
METNPDRPYMTDAQYRALLGVGYAVSPLFYLALVLAHETGHRLGSIRLLRWSDLDLTQQVVRWRGSNDKIGFEHATSLTHEAVAALATEKTRTNGVGDGWVFASSGDRSEPCSRNTFRTWWLAALQRAELPRIRGWGFHAFRRKFATEMKHTPLKDLCYLGGWKNSRTLIEVYQQPDPVTMRNALNARRPVATTQSSVEIGAEIGPN